MRKGRGKRGTGAHNGRKGVGTQGRHYVRVIMRESEGEKAVKLALPHYYIRAWKACKKLVVILALIL